MTLKTKLVLRTTAFITALTALMCAIFVSELLRGRVSQAETANDVLAHEVLLSTRNALQQGLKTATLTTPGESGFEAAVTKTLQDDEALTQTINAIVLYSPTVQDVYVSGANGRVLVSSDATLFSGLPPRRASFNTLAQSSVIAQWKAVFGKPQVFDITLPLQRNGRPFLFAHIGVRSSLLRNALNPWLRDAAFVAMAALLCVLVSAVGLSSTALRPVEVILQRLEALQKRSGKTLSEGPQEEDAVQRVTSTIDRLDQQIRTSEEQSVELASNLSQMLRTLRDGILLLSGDGVIAIVSESVQNFLPETVTATVGSSIYDVFPETTAVGIALRKALARRTPLLSLATKLEDGRPVELTLDFPEANTSAVEGSFGIMLTLHDPTAQEEVEREIDLARRLASIGRLTAGVGHEVKNPINAMVLHLELLRSKLGHAASNGAGRHLDVLASEMSRLDRVVQTLADFTRPLEPILREQPLRPILDSILQLVSLDAQNRGIRIIVEDKAAGVSAITDREMLHQALLNIVLNAMDAMTEGGVLTLQLTRQRHEGIVSIRDTGTGIPHETLEKIFNLYFTTKSTGSGIGLAMTWRIIQMLGGGITVRSNTDPDAGEQGTEFIVNLPLGHVALKSTIVLEVPA